MRIARILFALFSVFLILWYVSRRGVWEMVLNFFQ